MNMRSPSIFKFALANIVLLVVSISDVNGFVSPNGFTGSLIPHRSFTRNIHVTNTRTNAIAPATISPGAFSGATSIFLSRIFDQGAGAEIGLIQGVRTFLTSTSAFAVGGFFLIIPIMAFVGYTVAEKLASDTRRLRPEFWKKYEAKLGGAPLALRPALFEELETIMEPIIAADFEEKVESKNDNEANTEKDDEAKNRSINLDE